MHYEFHILENCSTSYKEIRELNELIENVSWYKATLILFNKWTLICFGGSEYKEYILEYLSKYHGKVIDNHFNKLPAYAEECGSFVKIDDKFFIQLEQPERYL